MSAKVYRVTVGDTEKTVAIDYDQESGIYIVTIDGIQYECTGVKTSSSGTSKSYDIVVDGVSNAVTIDKVAEETYDVTLNGIDYTCTSEEVDPGDSSSEDSSDDSSSEDSSSEDSSEEDSSEDSSSEETSSDDSSDEEYDSSDEEEEP